MKRSLAALLVVLFIVVACGPMGAASGSPGPGGSTPAIELAAISVPRASSTPADAAAAGAAIDAFGLDLYRRIAGSGDNVVVSPASIAIAVAMARAGARGDTATQIDDVLRSLGSDEHAAWISALDQALAGRSGTFPDGEGNDHDVLLRIANAPFAQRGMTLVPAFLEALGARFGAGLRLVDYQTDPEAVRALINAWVDDQTEERIPELLAPGDLDTLTRLVLVNAIYLKAAWQTPFAESATKPAPFTRLDGSIVDVPTMATDTDLTYASGSGWQAVELPYIGGSLAMTVIVPDDIAAFEAGLDADSFATITAALAPARVDLTLPRFSIETRTDLATTLAALGMPDAFDPDVADFSGITTEEQLYISAVIHQANIDVDEAGTEAAAATAVTMRTTSMPAEPVTLRVDRPFLFALRDVPTGAVLFLGRVGDPSATR
jgi:serpin B